MRTSSLKELTQNDHQQYRTRLQVLLFSVRDLKKNGPPLISPDGADQQTDTAEQYIEKLSVSIAKTLYQYHETIPFNDESFILDHQHEYIRVLTTMREALRHLVFGETVICEKTSDALIRCLSFHIYECEIKMQDSLPDEQNYQHPWLMVSKVLFQKKGDQKYCIETSIDIDKITQHIQGCSSTINTLIEFTNKPSFLDINNIKEYVDSIATHIADFFHSSHVQHDPNDNDGYDVKGHGIVIDKPNKSEAKEEWVLLYSGIKKTLEHHLAYRHIDHGLCQPIKKHLDSILNHLYEHRASIIEEEWKIATKTLMYQHQLPHSPSEKIDAIKKDIRKQSQKNLESSKKIFIEAIKYGFIISKNPRFDSDKTLSLLGALSSFLTEKPIEKELTLLLRSLKSFTKDPLLSDNAVPEDLFHEEDLNIRTPKKKKKKKNKPEKKIIPQSTTDRTTNDYIDKKDHHFGLNQGYSDDYFHQATRLIQRTFIEYRSKKDLDSLQKTMNEVVSHLFSQTSTTSIQIQTFFKHLEKILNGYTLDTTSQSDSIHIMHESLVTALDTTSPSDSIHIMYESLLTASAKYSKDALNPKTTIAWIPVDKLTQLIDREYKRTIQSHPYQELIRSESSTHPELIWFSKLTENTQAICRHMADVLDFLPNESEKFFFGSRLCEGLSIDSHMIDDNTDMDFFCLIPDTANIKHATTLLLNSLHSPTTSPFTLQIDNDETSTLEPFSIKVLNTTRNICNIKLLCNHHSITTPIDLTIISMTHDKSCDYEGTLLDQYRKLPIITTDGTGISLSVINTHMRPLNTMTISSDLQSHYAHELKHPTFHKFQQYTKNNLRCVMKKVLRSFYLSAVQETDLPDDIQVMSWRNTVKYPQEYTIKKHFDKELYTLCIHKTAWLTELKKKFPLKEVFNKLFDLCIGSIVPFNEQFYEFFDHIYWIANATREINSKFIALFDILFDELNPSDQEERKDWLNDIRKGEWLDPRSPHVHPQARQKISGDLQATAYTPHTFNKTPHYHQNEQLAPLDPDVYPCRGPSP